MNNRKCTVCGSNTRTILKDDTLVLQCLNEKCLAVQDFTISHVNQDDSKYAYYLDNLNNDSTVQIIISNIKKLRLEKKRGQSTMAGYLGVSAQRYGTIDRCEHQPTIVMLMKLARLFNVSLNDLYSSTTITQEQYKKLSTLVLVSRDDSKLGSIRVKSDKNILKLQKEILDFERKTGVTTRKIYTKGPNKDNKEMVAIKSTLQAKDEKLSVYCKKNNQILKQKYVVDYYNFEAAKKLLGIK
ncbi:MAG: helix-turn-helix transcriptional regulator [Clostridium paraputrificum]|uniref:helix-turn-helix transcriptional regulator n=1 Tax=Clostridium sp. TaxID=1506 RepID=UPI0025C5D006|nr:helix-turn-helix transcriptional regulator [Clostridium sp.]MBS5926233.1 helix-turn-helix transcriptional regulator [Clostridium sp.]